MPTMIITGNPGIERNYEICAKPMLRHMRTGVVISVTDYKRTNKTMFINMAEWQVFAIGRNYINNKIRHLQQLVEEQLYAKWHPNPCYETFVAAYYTFLVKMPSSWSRKKKLQMIGQRVDTRPDEGNYTYFLDNRLQGIAISDDKIISDKMANKRYGNDPCTIITVAPMSAEASISDREVASARFEHTNTVYKEVEKQKEALWNSTQ